MADNFSLCLVGAMDCLWFHQIILFPEPLSLFFSKTLKPLQLQQPNDESSPATTPSTSLSFSSLAEENLAVSTPPLMDESKEEEEEVKRKPPSVSISSNRSRSHSSSPSGHKHKKNHTNSTSCSHAAGVKLQKSMSCRSLKDLELEEVRGFMDLGFIFKKEHLSPRMIRIVPGLLRLGIYKTKQKTHQLINNLAADPDEKLNKDDDDDDDIEKFDEGVIRPYLSEAWLIKRPDSPLLNLRIPRFSASADMKKHLKFWARTVASEIWQQS